jgi:hypothetical protein
MQITSFVKTAVFAATFMTVSVSATAAMQTLGVIDSPLKTFNGGVFGSGQPTPIVFTDQLIFTLLANSSTSYNVIDFPIFNVYNTELTGLKLYAGAVGSGTLLGTGSGTAASFSISNVVTGAGDYYLEVSGKAGGLSGGLYSGSISSTVSPVPEPETYAMLLAGLGLMGAIARRRNKA